VPDGLQKEVEGRVEKPKGRGGREKKEIYRRALRKTQVMEKKG